MKMLLRLLITTILSLQLSYSLASDLKGRYETLDNLEYLFLMDQDTGEILLQKNADERISPSSMTKLMTAYVAFNEIKKGSITLGNQCLIGKDAWRKRGSTMFLNSGDVVSVNDLITGLLVVSGNDSSIALAQSISGSVKLFAELMTKTAKEIGLEHSSFKNPHGLNQNGHYMTLRDLATLARRLTQDFPEFMHYFTIKEFTYGDITQRNRNPLIKGSYGGATGMKTGYTSDGGYGIVGTATRDDRNLIAVVNNASSSKQRGVGIFELLDYGFDNFDKITFFKANSPVINANVWLGNKNLLSLVTKDVVAINITKNQSIDDVDLEVKYQDPLFTPIKKGQKVGRLIITIKGEVVRNAPLYASDDVNKANYLKRMWSVFKYKLTNLVEYADLSSNSSR